MNSPSARPKLARAFVTAVAGVCALLPLRGFASAGQSTHVTGVFDLIQVLAVGAIAGLVVWLAGWRRQKRLARQAESRVREMTALIEHADCLLWEAEVALSPTDWTWRMTLHNSAFCRKLFAGRPQIPGVDLWQHYQIQYRDEMNRRARQAMENGLPGYTQEFRAVRDGQTFWMHENVSITPMKNGRYWLVGLVTDLTAQRTAELARRESEQAMNNILAHAHCLLWRATVVLKDGVLEWPHFDLPQSQFSTLLFGDRELSPSRGFWDTLTIPEQEEMNGRSTKAILEGASGYAQQFRAINQHGRTFWLNERVSITPVSDTSWSLVGVVVDITPQQEAEEARRKSELHLSHLLERADTMIWQAQVKRVADGNLVWEMFVPKSQLHRRIFSCDPQDPLGFSWADKGVPENRELEQRAREAIVGGAVGYDQVFHVPRAKGDIWLSETVTIVPAGPDQWDLVGIITDITARHAAEEAWRTSQARLSKLLELADCLVWEATVTLGSDDVLHWDLYTQRSVLYRRIFGEDNETVLNWNRVKVPEHAEMTACATSAIKARLGGYTQEFHVEHPHDVIWLREVVTIVPLGDEKFRLVGVITDITPQRRAEEAHQKSELRLAALLDRADCMIWQGEARRRGPDDYEWKVFTPNSQLYRRLFGRTPEGVCHFPWDNGLVHELPEMKQRSRYALSNGLASYEQVFSYRLPDGDVWLSEQVTIRPHGLDHWELVGIITDITAQHAADFARKTSEQRLRDILTHAQCLLWEATVTIAPEGWLWEFSIQPSLLCQRLYGSPSPKPEHGLWREFTIPERSEMNQRCRRALEENRPGYEQVFQIVHRDGSVIWISENVTVRSLGNNRYSLVGVALDITAQRGAESALAAEKERLSVTLRAMKECVITTDIAGTVQFMNHAATVLTGWGATEAIGQSVGTICRLQDTRNDRPVDVPIGRVSQGDVIVDLPPNTRLVTRKDSRRQIEGCCAPIHATDSKVIGAVFVFRDVTEQERLEQELVRATRLESVGVLAGGIAHDFNNILTAVMGNLALAQLDIAPDTPAGSSLRSAEKAALRARDLTQQLLTFAKGGEPVRTAVQLDAIVREMTSFALHGSRVKAHFDMAPDLWPADADKGQIGRVVQNLVINAVQAMPQGGNLSVVVRNDPQDGMSQPGLAPGDYIQIAISDTGEGIKPEDVSRIFDPYFTTKQTGTGLGLAAVYSIVKKHRGYIEVDSQIGKGTTFRIWLPALRNRNASADTRVPWTAGAPERMNGRVLFMDDEEIIRDMAVGLLRRFGLDVDCAIDGAEAVEKYRASFSAGTRYDLVIMDLTVPGGMGGLAALGKLREIDPAVRAVVSSGYSSDPVLANFRMHGFAAVVAKPYEAHEISRVLREVLPRP
jgi:PAS domain S-box-containing protein